MTRELPTACIVGDGHVSTAIAKSLRDYGFFFECYSQDWWPQGGSGGAGGTGGLAAEQLGRCVERHGLGPHVISKTSVRYARRIDSGAWSVQLESGEARFFDALIVTSRPQLSPRTPHIPGADGFSVPSLHSRAYRGEIPFRGADVLIVGAGHSAENIALELTGYAGRVLLAPTPRRDSIGLSRPGRGARYLSFCSQPDLSIKRLVAVAKRGVRMVSEPVRIEGRTVYFAGGYSTDVDVIVYATGFSPVFDFLEQSLETAGGHEFELYKRVFRPTIDNLFFVGSFLPAIGCAAATAIQALLVAEYLRGTYALPDLFTMRNQPHYDCGRASLRLFDGAASSSRTERALARYTADLERELRRGRRRALRDGAHPPLPAIAAGLRPLAEPSQLATNLRTRALASVEDSRELQRGQATAGIAAA